MFGFRPPQSDQTGDIRHASCQRRSCLPQPARPSKPALPHLAVAVQTPTAMQPRRMPCNCSVRIGSVNRHGRPDPQRRAGELGREVDFVIHTAPKQIPYHTHSLPDPMPSTKGQTIYSRSRVLAGICTRGTDDLLPVPRPTATCNRGTGDLVPIRFQGDSGERFSPAGSGSPSDGKTTEPSGRENRNHFPSPTPKSIPTTPMKA